MAIEAPNARTAPIGVPVAANPWQSVARAFRGFFATSGRSSRSEYWWFALLFNVLVLATVWWESGRGGSGWITLLVVLVLLIPSISLCVRRLHDAGYSGAWFFVQFLPFIGWAWLLILLVQPSQRLRNQYGPGPDDFLLERRR
ncbi:MAG: DUF805 domain-containing protein [Actinobacteria bacterium]|jgi:uncharacterized membrane protein YhaH (DUF805 family)|nr:DUF805 domain-containing protein [Actinomycetota bacterium]